MRAPGREMLIAQRAVARLTPNTVTVGYMSRYCCYAVISRGATNGAPTFFLIVFVVYACALWRVALRWSLEWRLAIAALFCGSFWGHEGNETIYVCVCMCVCVFGARDSWGSWGMCGVGNAMTVDSGEWLHT